MPHLGRRPPGDGVASSSSGGQNPANVAITAAVLDGSASSAPDAPFRLPSSIVLTADTFRATSPERLASRLLDALVDRTAAAGEAGLQLLRVAGINQRCAVERNGDNHRYPYTKVA